MPNEMETFVRELPRDTEIQSSRFSKESANVWLQDLTWPCNLTFRAWRVVRFIAIQKSSRYSPNCEAGGATVRFRPSQQRFRAN